MSFNAQILKDFPSITFQPGPRFVWSPKDQTVYYEKDRIDSEIGRMTLLHELSHALLDHASYKSDLQLMKLEVEAWQKARELAKKYQITPDDSYIDECLESYRNWLYKRSMCPRCLANCLQDDSGIYHCHICGNQWSVPSSQLCKVRRKNLTK